MNRVSFIFFFYEIKNPWGGENLLSRGLRVEHDAEGRYERYFLSFWFELPDVTHAQRALAQLQALERGDLREACFGGDEWEIHAKLDGVTFVSNEFDDWNDGTNNVFSYNEFKLVLTAWNQFLTLPPESPGSEYKFTISDEIDHLTVDDHVQLIHKHI